MSALHDYTLHDVTAAARVIAERTGVERHDVAVVLGSGWVAAADFAGTPVASIPPESIPGFEASGIAGHSGSIRSLLTPAGTRVLVLGARHHFYQSRDAQAVAHGMRVAAATGCQVAVLTNGCGSIRADVGPGTPVLISDHINLTGATPLLGPTFVDMTHVYSPRLRSVAKEVDASLGEGVYAQFAGPQYETPAEVRMAAAMGAHLVGMSTALEAIAARAAGLEVLGLALVTNLAAGISGESLSHAEVLAAGDAAGPRLARLLANILGRL